MIDQKLTATEVALVGNLMPESAAECRTLVMSLEVSKPCPICPLIPASSAYQGATQLHVVVLRVQFAQLLMPSVLGSCIFQQNDMHGHTWHNTI